VARHAAVSAPCITTVCVSDVYRCTVDWSAATATPPRSSACAVKAESPIGSPVVPSTALAVALRSDDSGVTRCTQPSRISIALDGMARKKSDEAIALEVGSFESVGLAVIGLK